MVRKLECHLQKDGKALNFVMAKLFTEWMRDRYNFVLTKGNLFVCPVCGKFIEFSEDVSVCDHYEVEKVFSSDPVYIYNLNIGRQTVDN